MTFSENRSMPDGAKGHTSVARVADDWYIVCRSSALRQKPLAEKLLGTPITVFRNRAGEVGALLDRCPHRNVPLSLGKVRGDVLQCSYHGWEFDRLGVCRTVPGLCADGTPKGRSAHSFAVREDQGFVWVYAKADAKPERDPFRFPLMDDTAYTTVCQEMEVEASVHATAENALDVPHTAYLHGGLFRSTSGTRKQIEVIVRRVGDRVEAEYVGESRPPGLVGRMLAPGGGEVMHVDRFILPSIAQVEYKLGDDTHICVSSALTPVDDFHTRLFSVVSLRLPFPSWVITPILKPIVMRIFRQDADILRSQTAMIRLFGGEQYFSTEVDVLGGNIYRLLKQAERGERDAMTAPVISKLRMMI